MTAGSGSDDLALVRASQQGDRDAFGVLVARHGSSVLGVTTRILGGGAEAEDVAQETFVAAFRGLGSFQFGSKFSTWLYRIAVNKCTDALRARRSTVVSLDAEEDGQSRWEPVDDETPYFELEQAELAGALDEALRALPHLYREAFVLKHVEGLGYDEMSVVTGVNRDTLKMRVYKARTRLCRTLAHLQGAYR
jgi:RNA polymerase sigma-70 factor (ECF subfamily)